ncbi:hypothetical protein TrVE_jg9434 [Triparma verrucosa]|uniref:Uncharacterized protein n=1 Tax=Triparma verrucosa TaxID=1606542 RepID=A0A9W7EZL7_9STRA|nr:hypothetical protein TrVE_jg9434 [Triparma verrucosa]
MSQKELLAVMEEINNAEPDETHLPNTRRLVALSATSTRAFILANKLMITKNSLPLPLHFIERVCMSVLGILSLTNARHTPIRNEAENKSIRKVTGRVCSMLDVCALFIRVPPLMQLVLNGTLSPEASQMFVSFSLIQQIAIWLVMLREATHYSRRGRWLDTEVLMNVRRSNFWNIRLHSSTSKMSAMEYLRQIAKISEADDFLNIFLVKPTLFEEVKTFNEGAGRIQRSISKKNSFSKTILDSTNIHEKTLNKTFSLFASLKQMFPLGVGIFSLLVLLGAAPGGEPVNLAMGCFPTFILVVMTTQVFVLETVKDFWSHKRLLSSFLYSIGALSEAEVQSKGHSAMLKKLVAEPHEFKFICENAEDLCAILFVYDTILKYIKMRTRFHGGYIAGAIVVNIITAGMFLLSASFESMRAPVMVRVVLVWLSVFYAISLSAILYPLIKSSILIHDIFLRWLCSNRLTIHSELARGYNGSALNDKVKANLRSQLPLLETKREELMANPSRLTVCGVNVTAGNLGQFLAALSCSILSGLVKQSAQ